MLPVRSVFGVNGRGVTHASKNRLEIINKARSHQSADTTPQTILRTIAKPKGGHEGPKIWSRSIHQRSRNPFLCGISGGRKRNTPAWADVHIEMIFPRAPRKWQTVEQGLNAIAFPGIRCLALSDNDRAIIAPIP